MARLKLAYSLIFLLIMSIGFSSYFALTAVADLYTESLNASSIMVDMQMSSIQPKINIFLNEQLNVALMVVLVASFALVRLIAKYVPLEPERWTLKNLGWPLLSISALAQLLALNLYFLHFLSVAPTDQTSSAGQLDVLIEMITAVAVSTLFCVELLILLLGLFQANITVNQSTSTHLGNIRPAMFLFMLGLDLPSAFIPLYMENLYQPMFGLPKDIILGLPISAMFFCVGISIVTAGIWLDRRGWQEPCLVGIALAGIGKLYAWLAPSAIHFIPAMGIVGLGYGLSLMASQGFVISQTDAKSKARCLAYLFAGFYASEICGKATGAMLAERFGYSAVFLIGTVVIFLALGYVFLTMRDSFVHPKQYNNTGRGEHVQNTVPEVKAQHYWNFLTNRYVLGLVFLSSLPSAIAVIGFLNYFSPIYLNRLGASESTIGALLIMYGLCMVYVGPFVSKFVDRTDDKRLFVIIGCILGGFAFVSFQFLSGYSATIVAVLLLGLSSCFVLASQTTYALTLDVTKELGQGRAIGIFRASSRIGQMLGPMLFGWLIVATDINTGITYFGIAYLITALLFAFVTQKRRAFKDEIIYETSPASCNSSD
jgi:predicted MFS family arabinose efflux permease